MPFFMGILFDRYLKMRERTLFNERKRKNFELERITFIANAVYFNLKLYILYSS